MYAIVEIAGLQYRVEQDQQLLVNRLEGAQGDKVILEKVLLTDNGTVQVGAPVIEGLTVEAKIVEHLKGEKIIVFKKKRRKGYRKKNGHRQYLTKLEILSIGGVATPKKKVALPADKKQAAAPKVKPVAKATGKADDLKKIEGIGPKIASTLAEAGISTYAELAKTDSAKISEIIAGVRGNHVPDTWPQQSQLAADGKWEELKVLQDKLDGGIEK